VRHISGKAMKKILEDRGWYRVRTSGSHFIFRHPNSPDLTPGTQRDIMKKAGLTNADL
jgi:predicted RNA binding protein YcfA (HicA-like mRNA interferase family)